ncbi:MAG: shikimate dehydrogenase [Clostridia bacterium]|nr:shikimate dehydrogenase [Clostridia bacterium]
MTRKLRLDVVGDPIEHSKSPLIHGTALQELDLPYEYRKVKVQKGALPDYINNAKKSDVLGFNLTMPHKQDIIPYLDYIDPEAERFHSVNTVHINDGKLYGYNTDGCGFVYAMKDLGYCAENKNIVILGAGGVVSTIALKMELEGAKKITILNRTLSSAESIAKKLTQVKVLTNTLTCENIKNAVMDCDVLVNGTPLGMEGMKQDFEDLTFLDSLKEGALVYDLIYTPEETNLIKAAKQLGFSTINGFGMLIYQGLLADEIFLGHSLNFELLKKKIENKFKNLKK